MRARSGLLRRLKVARIFKDLLLFRIRTIRAQVILLRTIIGIASLPVIATLSLVITSSSKTHLIHSHQGRQARRIRIRSMHLSRNSNKLTRSNSNPLRAQPLRILSLSPQDLPTPSAISNKRANKQATPLDKAHLEYSKSQSHSRRKIALIFSSQRLRLNL